MYDDVPLTELPEAVPLRRVSPLWRVLAVLALIALFLIVPLTCLLAILLMQYHRRQAMLANTTPATRVMMAPPMVAPMAMFPGAMLGQPAQPPVELPYPVVADLAQPRPPHLAAHAPENTRQRFLAKSQVVWIPNAPFAVQHATVSPDGRHLAAVLDQRLVAGPVENPQFVALANDANAPMAWGGGMPGNVPMGAMPAVPGGPAGMMGAMMGQPEFGPDLAPDCVPAWTADSQAAYLAGSRGQLLCYRLHNGPAVLFPGGAPAPVPPDMQKVIYVRSRPVLKAAGPDQAAPVDPTEVVLRDTVTGEERVLIPASGSSWKGLAVSPDGKRLALVSDRGSEGQPARPWRVFLLDLAGGEPKPVTPPASFCDSVCWTPDSQSLIYARKQSLRPADHWEGDAAGPHAEADLFHWDLQANREMRLSRGGGFLSPSIDQDGRLYFLTWVNNAGQVTANLRGIALDQALASARQQGEPGHRDAAAWTKFLAQILKEAKVSPTADAGQLTPEALARVADQFARLYREQFGSPPPSDLAGLLRLKQELSALTFARPVQEQVRLALGAVQGDYLRRQHQANWHLVKGPLVPPDKPETAPASAFAFAVNPFEFLDADLPALPRQARGRRLVLTNDPAAAHAALAAAADPDLARGVELLEREGPEAEKVLLSVVKKERNRDNVYLAVHVAKLLYDGKRLAALRRWLEQWQDKPHDATLHNLRGLVFLTNDDVPARPDMAIEAFQTALRCDLSFGPAYLNLAQAYQANNNPAAALQCLERYLELLPNGPHAADARQRLAGGP